MDTVFAMDALLQYVNEVLTLPPNLGIGLTPELSRLGRAADKFGLNELLGRRQ